MSVMQTSLRTLSFFQVLLCVTMKSKAVRVFAGTEGGSVNIDCPYPDGYQYTPQYFCRDPCSSVLITSTKADEVVSKGRYSAVNTVSARSFSVTIRNLKLSDSGVYYCGYDKWGYDKLTKVNVTLLLRPHMFQCPGRKTTLKLQSYPVPPQQHQLLQEVNMCLIIQHHLNKQIQHILDPLQAGMGGLVFVEGCLAC